jgi:putative peptidoglycan binding protein
MSRRRRRAAATEAEPDRGLVTRLLLHSPKDTVAGALAFAAVTGIVANALLLQAGRHPSPMFGSVSAMPAISSVAASPLPRPRPVDAEPASVEQRSAEPTIFDGRSADVKISDPVGNLVKTTSVPATHSHAVRPLAPAGALSHADAAAGQRRVAAVQRALTQYGYGQLKPTGTVGSDTQAAIQKFEFDRKLPVTGKLSERLVQELTTVIGHPID